MRKDLCMASGGKWAYVKAPRKTSVTQGNRRIWADQKKYEAVAVWIATGSLTQTALQTKIPIETLKTWKKQDWWNETVREIQDDDYSKLDATLTKVIDKALLELIDRVEKGDAMFDPRTGDIRRVPAKLRDLQQAVTSIVDKRQLIRKQPTKIVRQENTASQLQALAQEFAKFVTGQEKKETMEDLHVLIDGEDVFQNDDGTYEIKETTDAIHDQRQEKL